MTRKSVLALTAALLVLSCMAAAASDYGTVTAEPDPTPGTAQGDNGGSAAENIGNRERLEELKEINPSGALFLIPSFLVHPFVPCTEKPLRICAAPCTAEALHTAGATSPSAEGNASECEAAPLNNAAVAAAPEMAARISEPYAFALKTNLLFDAVGGFSMGAEFPIGRHFSVGGDAAYAYWQIDNMYALQMIQWDTAGKYWFDQSRGILTGWSAGAYFTWCSRYDIQWKDGWQGDGFFSAGACAGYAVRIGGKLNLEFSLAAGYFYTPLARAYTRPENGRLMWRETRREVSRFSLTKVQVNLVWLLGGKQNGGAKWKGIARWQEDARWKGAAR